MSSRILFRGFELLNRGVGLGDIFDYSQVCYLKGNEMGFDEIHIVFPRLGSKGRNWYELSEKDYNYQETKFLPWKWYPRNQSINENEWDIVIDTTKSDSLYEGFPGIAPIFWHVSQYLSFYYKEKKNPPYLNVTKSAIKNPYILFQYRSNFPGGYESKSRVTIAKDFESILSVIREEFGNKYQYWKMGNKSPIENRFDYIIPPMYNDLDGLAKLVCNASVMITAHGGMMNLSFLMRDLSTIVICLSPSSYSGYLDVWKRTIGRNYKVERHPNWVDNRTLLFERGKEIDKTKVQKFLREEIQ